MNTRRPRAPASVARVAACVLFVCVPAASALGPGPVSGLIAAPALYGVCALLRGVTAQVAGDAPAAGAPLTLGLRN